MEVFPGGPHPLRSLPPAVVGGLNLASRAYRMTTVTAATSALLVEALGLVIGVWRVTVGKGPKDLQPTTQPGRSELQVEVDAGGE
jgi:hypothetical protein